MFTNKHILAPLAPHPPYKIQPSLRLGERITRVTLSAHSLPQDYSEISASIMSCDTVPSAHSSAVNATLHSALKLTYWRAMVPMSGKRKWEIDYQSNLAHCGAHDTG